MLSLLTGDPGSWQGTEPPPAASARAPGPRAAPAPPPGPAARLLTHGRSPNGTPPPPPHSHGDLLALLLGLLSPKRCGGASSPTPECQSSLGTPLWTPPSPTKPLSPLRRLLAFPVPLQHANEQSILIAFAVQLIPMLRQALVIASCTQPPWPRAARTGRGSPPRHPWLDRGRAGGHPGAGAVDRVPVGHGERAAWAASGWSPRSGPSTQVVGQPRLRRGGTGGAGGSRQRHRESSPVPAAKEPARHPLPHQGHRALGPAGRPRPATLCQPCGDGDGDGAWRGRAGAGRRSRGGARPGCRAGGSRGAGDGGCGVPVAHGSTGGPQAGPAGTPAHGAAGRGWALPAPRWP